MLFISGSKPQGSGPQDRSRERSILGRIQVNQYLRRVRLELRGWAGSKALRLEDAVQTSTLVTRGNSGPRLRKPLPSGFQLESKPIMSSSYELLPTLQKFDVVEIVAAAFYRFQQTGR